MSIIDGKKTANEYLLEVARMGAVAALKAPNMANTEIKTMILTEEDLRPLTEILVVLGETSAFIYGDGLCGKKSFEAETPIVELLIGANLSQSDLNWNCGACGFDTCAEFNRYAKEKLSAGSLFVGPSCNWKVLDFGTAQSWAAASIWHQNVDNRAQASYGAAAMMVGHMEGCTQVVGISIGPCRDTVWYNRPDMAYTFDMNEHEQFVLNTLPQLFVGFCGGGYPQVKDKPNWPTEMPKYLKTDEASPEVIAKTQDVMGRLGELIVKERKRLGKE